MWQYWTMQANIGNRNNILCQYTQYVPNEHCSWISWHMVSYKFSLHQNPWISIFEVTVLHEFSSTRGSLNSSNSQEGSNIQFSIRSSHSNLNSLTWHMNCCASPLLHKISVLPHISCQPVCISLLYHYHQHLTTSIYNDYVTYTVGYITWFYLKPVVHLRNSYCGSHTISTYTSVCRMVSKYECDRWYSR